jgi:putative hydrolase of the HAD superfamily
VAVDGLRAEIAARWCWDEQLVACLDGVRGRARTAIVSNAWPHARAPLAADGVADLVDAVVLSCEAGVAKPDRLIFELTLARLGAEPGSALFIDDTPGHVAAAQALGMAGHVHTGTKTTMAVIESFVNGSCDHDATWRNWNASWRTGSTWSLSAHLTHFANEAKGIFTACCAY